MSNIENPQNDLIQSQSDKGLGKNKISALDRKFPSVWLIGTGIFLVILLTLWSGWKIVNIERERAHVESERRLLERDKEAYEKILKELPELEDRQQDLFRELSDQQGKVKNAKTILENLNTQVKAAHYELERAKTESNEAKAEAKVLRDKSAALKSEIQDDISEAVYRKQQVEGFSQTEKLLRQSNSQLQVQVAQRNADLSGLKQEIQNKKQILEHMAQDTAELNKLSERFNIIAKNMEASQQAASDVIQGLNTKAMGLNSAVDSVNSQSQAISAQIQAVSSESSNLSRVVQDIYKDGEIINKTAGEIQKANTILDKAINRLQDAAGGADKQAQLMAQTLESPLTSFKDSISTLSKSLNIFTDQVNIIGSEAETLGIHAKDLKDVKDAASGSVSQLATASVSIRETASILSKTRAELATTVENLSKNTDTSKTQLDSQLNFLGNHLGNFQTKIETLDAAISQFSDTAGSLLQTSENIQTANRKLDDTMGQFKEAIGSIDKQAQNLANSVDEPLNNLRNGIVTINTTADGVSKQVQTFEDYLNAVGVHIDSFKSKINAIDTPVSEISVTVGNLQKVDATLSKLQLNIANEINALNGLVEQANKQLDGQTGTLINKLVEIEVRLRGISDHVQTLDQTISRIVEKSHNTNDKKTNE